MPEFSPSHVFGMALAMKDAEREAFDPFDIGLFGAIRVVFYADCIAHLVE